MEFTASLSHDSMSKSPAFQFYPTDFVGSGTVGRATIDEVGIYTLLLCLDWNDEGFEFDVPRLARWCRTTERKVLAAWKYLQCCFTERDGKYYNKRLEEERQKQAQRRAQLSENGKKGGRPKKAKGLPKKTKSFPEPKANDNQNKSLSSLSSSSTLSSVKEPLSKSDDLEPAEEPGTTPPDQPAVPTDWVAQFASDWEEIVKGVPDYGRIGKTAKAAVERFGFDRARVAWRRFVADPKARQYRFASFSQDFGDYEPQLWGVNGEFTPEQLRELGIIQ